MTYVFFVHNITVQAQNIDPLKSKQHLDLERARFLVTQAFDEDDKGNAEEAIELYSEAVELCLTTVSKMYMKPYSDSADEDKMCLIISTILLYCSSLHQKWT